MELVAERGPLLALFVRLLHRGLRLRRLRGSPMRSGGLRRALQPPEPLRVDFDVLDHPGSNT
jgi:hypothetical protein